MSNAVDQSMKEAVRQGVFPSAELLVAKKGSVVHHNYYGDARSGTNYDIASLTKPISTSTLVMMLSAEGKLKPDQPISSWIGEANRPEHDEITIRMLMDHRSGLPSWKPYYRELPTSLIGTAEGKQHIINACIDEPLIDKPDTTTVYSDIGFILLGVILERASGMQLDELFTERISKPLELEHTFFIRNENPGVKTTSRRTDTTADQHVPSSKDKTPKAPGGSRRRFAATEDCPWRGHVIHGEVHDQNAFAMGGMAGHAGLFSTAQDIHRFISKFMTSLEEKQGIVPIDTIKKFIPLDGKMITPPSPGMFVGGWDTPSARNSAAGHYSSKHAIGHLAYTGCSIWIDQEQDFWVILLTNRIHPSTTNQKIKAFRPSIHDIIHDELLA